MLRSSNAFFHFPPFSQALVPALYVTVLGSICEKNDRRNKEQLIGICD